VTKTPQERADELFELAGYLLCLAIDRNRPAALYNVGLIYKYQRKWQWSDRRFTQARMLHGLRSRRNVSRLSFGGKSR
jgi:hypothetical protein